MGGRDLLGASADTVKNGIAAPDTGLAIDAHQDFFRSRIPWIDQKSIGLRQHGRAQVSRISFEGRAYSNADSAEDTVDIGIDFLPFLLTHAMFLTGWDGFSVEKGFYLAIVFEETRHIDDEVTKDRKVGEGIDGDRPAEEVLDMGSTGQDHFTVDAHSTGTTDRSPAGITKRKGPVLFILNTKEGFQQVHPFPGFQAEGVDPALRLPFLMKPYDS